MTDLDHDGIDAAALEIPPQVLAFDIACRYAAQHPRSVRVRTADPNFILDPDALPRRSRNVVEILIDSSGVLVAATGWDCTRSLFFAEVPLPASARLRDVEAFEAALGARGSDAALAVVRSLGRGAAREG